MSSGGRRRGGNGNFSSEDQALNMIAREAEQRLAAKRAARAEARSIRMKELERQQKEADERMDKEYQLNLLVDDMPKKRLHQRSADDANVTRNTDAYVKSLQDSLREVEENYRKAMVSNAQLDNEKQALSYQVDYLKDRLGDEEENVQNFKDELTQLNRVYNNLTRSNERTVDELERFKYALAERDKILEEYGINPDGTKNVDHEEQQQLAPSPVPNGLDALPTDIVDAGQLDKASFKSQSSVSSTTASEDRELLLEQIKSLKDEVAELRRENDSEAFQLQDMAVDELRPNMGIDKRVTETTAVDSCELERSTFVDVSDEARAIDDDDQAAVAPDESNLIASGSVVNNNEKNDDFEVIDTTLNHPNAVPQFEDASYESSARFTESLDSAVLLSEVADPADADSMIHDSIDVARDEESTSPMHMVQDGEESVVVTQTQPCYYSDFDIVEEDPNEKHQKANQVSKIEGQELSGKNDLGDAGEKEKETHVLVTQIEKESPPEQLLDDKAEQKEIEGKEMTMDSNEIPPVTCVEEEKSQKDNLAHDAESSAVISNESHESEASIASDNKSVDDQSVEVVNTKDTDPIPEQINVSPSQICEDQNEKQDAPGNVESHEECKDKTDVSPTEQDVDIADETNVPSEDVAAVEDSTPPSKTIDVIPSNANDQQTVETEQCEDKITVSESLDSSPAVVASSVESISSAPSCDEQGIKDNENALEPDKLTEHTIDDKLDERVDDAVANTKDDLQSLKRKDTVKDDHSEKKPIKILKAVKGDIASNKTLGDDSVSDKSNKTDVVVVDESIAQQHEEIQHKHIEPSKESKSNDNTNILPSALSTDANWKISVESSPPPVPKERTKKKKKKKRRKSKDVLRLDDADKPTENETVEDSKVENNPTGDKQTAEEPAPESEKPTVDEKTTEEPAPDSEKPTVDEATVKDRPVSIVVQEAEEKNKVEEVAESSGDAGLEAVETQSAASNSPLLLDVETRGASHSLSESSDIDCQDDDAHVGNSDRENEAPRKRSKSKKGSKRDSKKEGCKTQ